MCINVLYGVRADVQRTPFPPLFSVLFTGDAHMTPEFKNDIDVKINVYTNYVINVFPTQ